MGMPHILVHLIPMVGKLHCLLVFSVHSMDYHSSAYVDRDAKGTDNASETKPRA